MLRAAPCHEAWAWPEGRAGVAHVHQWCAGFRYKGHAEMTKDLNQEKIEESLRQGVDNEKAAADAAANAPVRMR